PVGRKGDMTGSATGRGRYHPDFLFFERLLLIRIEGINVDSVCSQVLDKQETLVRAENGGMNVGRFLPTSIGAAALILYVLHHFFKTAIISGTEYAEASA